MGAIKLAIIAARARNGVIGRDNTLPWRLREDLQQFKRLTTGHPIIMGRKTWESLGRPLPGRTNIVVSRQADYRAEGAVVVNTLEEAIEAAGKASDSDNVFVIGGAQLYEQALSLADTLWITEVHAEVDGDAVFPAFDTAQFAEISREHFKANEQNDFDFDLVRFDRRP